jgi:sugar phosphate permease
MSSIDVCAVTAPRKIQVSIFWRGVLIWGLATLFYAYDYLLNVAPGGMKPQLSQAFNLSAGDLGILSSCYLWTYGLMQIPAGLLMDTVGPRKLLTFAGLSCAIGALLFGLADTIVAACIGRLFMGFGASFAVVGCSKIASVWFPPRRFALFMGIMVAIGTLGAAFGLAAVNPIIQNYGWKQTLFGGAVISFALSAAMWMILRDKPSVTIAVETVTVKQVPILTGLKEVIVCKQDWYAAIYAGLMYVPTLAFGALLGTPYLVEAHGFSQADAGFLSSLLFVGWVFGGPVYGWVSDYIGRRNIPMYFANISTLLVSLWLIYGYGYSFNSVAIAMFLLGFFSSGFLIAFVVTREKNRPEISGTAIGFINMLNTFSGAFFQLAIGWILDLVATDAVYTEAGKAFSMLDYQKALTCIPVCLIISLFMLMRVKETYCIVKHSD